MPALITTDLVALDADLGGDKTAVIGRLAELVAGAGRATDAGALQRIFQQVDQLERTRMATRQPRALDERTTPFLLAGLGFVALALLLGATRAVRAP